MLGRSISGPSLTLTVVLTATAILAGRPAFCGTTCVPLGIPNPSACWVPLSAPACPAGDLSYTVTVIAYPCEPGGPSLPVFNARVVLDIARCATLDTCASGGGLVRNSQGNGNAQFLLHAGGGSGDSCVAVSADGFFLRHVYLASTDQDGDLDVDDDDVAILAAKVGTDDPSGDINGDGHVTNIDLSLVYQHLNHGCPGALAVPTDHSGTIAFVIREPRPNPARGNIVVPFELGQPGVVRLRVYDLFGRNVRELANSARPAGTQRIVWDARDDRGASVRPGVYLVRGEANGVTSHARVAVLRD
jgi:hypothetical protein